MLSFKLVSTSHGSWKRIFQLGVWSSLAGEVFGALGRPDAISNFSIPFSRLQVAGAPPKEMVLSRLSTNGQHLGWPDWASLDPDSGFVNMTVPFDQTRSEIFQLFTERDGNWHHDFVIVTPRTDPFPDFSFYSGRNVSVPIDQRQFGSNPDTYYYTYFNVTGSPHFSTRLSPGLTLRSISPPPEGAYDLKVTRFSMGTDKAVSRTLKIDVKTKPEVTVPSSRPYTVGGTSIISGIHILGSGPVTAFLFLSDPSAGTIVVTGAPGVSTQTVGPVTQVSGTATGVNQVLNSLSVVHAAGYSATVDLSIGLTDGFGESIGGTVVLTGTSPYRLPISKLPDIVLPTNQAAKVSLLGRMPHWQVGEALELVQVGNNPIPNGVTLTSIAGRYHLEIEAISTSERGSSTIGIRRAGDPTSVVPVSIHRGATGGSNTVVSASQGQFLTMANGEHRVIYVTSQSSSNVLTSQKVTLDGSVEPPELLAPVLSDTDAIPNIVRLADGRYSVVSLKTSGSSRTIWHTLMSADLQQSIATTELQVGSNWVTTLSQVPLPNGKIAVFWKKADSSPNDKIWGAVVHPSTGVQVAAKEIQALTESAVLNAWSQPQPVLATLLGQGRALTDSTFEMGIDGTFWVFNDRLEVTQYKSMLYSGKKYSVVDVYGKSGHGVFRPDRRIFSDAGAYSLTSSIKSTEMGTYLPGAGNPLTKVFKVSDDRFVAVMAYVSPVSPNPLKIQYLDKDLNRLSQIQEIGSPGSPGAVRYPLGIAVLSPSELVVLFRDSNTLATLRVGITPQEAAPIDSFRKDITRSILSDTDYSIDLNDVFYGLSQSTYFDIHMEDQSELPNWVTLSQNSRRVTFNPGIDAGGTYRFVLTAGYGDRAQTQVVQISVNSANKVTIGSGYSEVDQVGDGWMLGSTASNWKNVDRNGRVVTSNSYTTSGGYSHYKTIQLHSGDTIGIQGRRAYGTPGNVGYSLYVTKTDARGNVVATGQLFDATEDIRYPVIVEQTDGNFAVSWVGQSSSVASIKTAVMAPDLTALSTVRTLSNPSWKSASSTKSIQIGNNVFLRFVSTTSSTSQICWASYSLSGNLLKDHTQLNPLIGTYADLIDAGNGQVLAAKSALVSGQQQVSVTILDAQLNSGNSVVLATGSSASAPIFKKINDQLWVAYRLKPSSAAGDHIYIQQVGVSSGSVSLIGARIQVDRDSGVSHGLPFLDGDSRSMIVGDTGGDLYLFSNLERPVRALPLRTIRVPAKAKSIIPLQGFYHRNDLNFTAANGPTWVTIDNTQKKLVIDATSVTGGTSLSITGTVLGDISGDPVSVSIELTSPEGNRAPIVNGTSPVYRFVRPGDVVTYTVPTSKFYDPDHDSITVVHTGVMPPGLTFNAATGRYSGTISPSASGEYTRTVVASDGFLSSNPLSLIWTVLPVAPSLTQPQDITLAQGTSLDTVITVSDDTEVQLEVKKTDGSGLPGYLQATQVGTSGSVRLTSLGPLTKVETVGLRITETRGGLSSSTTMTLRVTNTKPVVAHSDSDITVQVGSEIPFSVTQSTFSDVDSLTQWLDIPVQNGYTVIHHETQHNVTTIGVQSTDPSRSGVVTLRFNTQTLVGSVRAELGSQLTLFQVDHYASDGLDQSKTSFNVKVTNAIPTITTPEGQQLTPGQPFDIRIPIPFESPVGNSITLGFNQLPTWLNAQVESNQIRLYGTAPRTSQVALIQLSGSDGTDIVYTDLPIVIPDTLMRVIGTMPKVLVPVTGAVNVTVPLATMFEDLNQQLLQVRFLGEDGNSLPSWITVAMASDQSVANLTGQLPATFSGNLLIRVQATDRIDFSDTNRIAETQFEIGYENRVPTVIQSLPISYILSDSTPKSIQIPDTLFSDPDGEPLRYELRDDSGHIISATTTPYQFDSASRTLTTTPSYGDSRIDVLSLRAVDPSGAFASQNVVIVVHPPSINVMTPVQLPTLKANQAVSYLLENVFSFPTNRPVVYALSQGDGMLNLSVKNGQTWIVGVPGPRSQGVHTYRLTGTCDGLSESTYFSAYVADSSPTFTLPFGLVSVKQGDQVELPLSAYVSDADQDAVVAQLINPPAWVTLDSNQVIHIRPISVNRVDFSVPIQLVNQNGIPVTAQNLPIRVTGDLPSVTSEFQKIETFESMSPYTYIIPTNTFGHVDHLAMKAISTGAPPFQFTPQTRTIQFDLNPANPYEGQLFSYAITGNNTFGKAVQTLGLSVIHRREYLDHAILGRPSAIVGQPTIISIGRAVINQDMTPYRIDLTQIPDGYAFNQTSGILSGSSLVTPSLTVKGQISDFSGVVDQFQFTITQQVAAAPSSQGVMVGQPDQNNYFEMSAESTVARIMPEANGMTNKTDTISGFDVNGGQRIDLSLFSHLTQYDDLVSRMSDLSPTTQTRSRKLSDSEETGVSITLNDQRGAAEDDGVSIQRIIIKGDGVSIQSLGPEHFVLAQKRVPPEPWPVWLWAVIAGGSAVVSLSVLAVIFRFVSGKNGKVGDEAATKKQDQAHSSQFHNVVNIEVEADLTNLEKDNLANDLELVLDVDTREETF